LPAMADDAGRTGELPGSILVATHLTKNAAVLGGLDDAHLRQSMTGTVEQVVDQLVAYRDAGVEEIHTLVSTDDAYGAPSGVDAMELFLREVWPAFLAR